jgi:hypothetical protein
VNPLCAVLTSDVGISTLVTYTLLLTSDGINTLVTSLCSERGRWQGFDPLSVAGKFKECGINFRDGVVIASTPARPECWDTMKGFPRFRGGATIFVA